MLSSSRDKMHATYRSGEGGGILCNSGTELRLGGRRTRRARIINGMGKRGGVWVFRLLKNVAREDETYFCIL